MGGSSNPNLSNESGSLPFTSLWSLAVDAKILMSAIASVTLACSRRRCTFGMASAASEPVMVTTNTTSMSVKPRRPSLANRRAVKS